MNTQSYIFTKLLIVFYVFKSSVYIPNQNWMLSLWEIAAWKFCTVSSADSDSWVWARPETRLLETISVKSGWESFGPICVGGADKHLSQTEKIQTANALISPTCDELYSHVSDSDSRKRVRENWNIFRLHTCGQIKARGHALKADLFHIFSKLLISFLSLVFGTLLKVNIFVFLECLSPKFGFSAAESAADLLTLNAHKKSSLREKAKDAGEIIARRKSGADSALSYSEELLARAEDAFTLLVGAAKTTISHSRSFIQLHTICVSARREILLMCQQIIPRCFAFYRCTLSCNKNWIAMLQKEIVINYFKPRN